MSCIDSAIIKALVEHIGMNPDDVPIGGGSSENNPSEEVAINYDLSDEDNINKLKGSPNLSATEDLTWVEVDGKNCLMAPRATLPTQIGQLLILQRKDTGAKQLYINNLQDVSAFYKLQSLHFTTYLYNERTERFEKSNLVFSYDADLNKYVAKGITDDVYEKPDYYKGTGIYAISDYGYQHPVWRKIVDDCMINIIPLIVQRMDSLQTRIKTLESAQE